MDFKAYLTTLHSRRATMLVHGSARDLPLLALIGRGKADIKPLMAGLKSLRNNECLFRKSIVGRPSGAIAKSLVSGGRCAEHGGQRCFDTWG